MPQKKNVDLAELLRSKVHVVLGSYSQVVGMSANLMSGYNRDIQDTKKPLFESLGITADCLKVSILLLQGIHINKSALEKAMTPELYATHHALDLVKQGLPFRAAYKKVGAGIPNKQYYRAQILKASVHTGSIGNLGLEYLNTLHQSRLEAYRKNKKQCMDLQQTLMKGGDTT